MKKAFTLGELLIVLSCISVITLVILPIAMKSSPDNNVLKFRKANTTLGTVIRELVNSDYYTDGDLGVARGGVVLNTTSGTDQTKANRAYFCKSLAEMLSTKYINCEFVQSGPATYERTVASSGGEQTAAALASMKEKLDSSCLNVQNQHKKYIPQIITSDDVIWYERDPDIPFGYTISGVRVFTPPQQEPGSSSYKDNQGFDVVYKVICIDVDGIQEAESEDEDEDGNKIMQVEPFGEDPFGYGIRADGKIIPGKRADEWINKSLQKQ